MKLKHFLLLFGSQRILPPDKLLGPSLLAWWRAEDLSNGAVASWASFVGSITPVQGTGSAQPTKAATSFNSAYPGATFGGDDYLSVDAIGSMPTGADASEVWLVVDADAGQIANTFFGYGASGANSRMLRTDSDSNWSALATGASATDPNVTPTPAVICGRFSGAEGVVLRVNGIDVASAAGTPATGTTRTVIGTDTGNTPSQFAEGVIAEIAVTAALSAGQRQRLETYWKRKYGIAF